MREPPLGLETVPDRNLQIFFDEILAAPTTEELLLGLYEKAVPALKSGMEKHGKDTNHLTDQPTVRLCRFALLELDDLLAFGAKSIAALVDEDLSETPAIPAGKLFAAEARRQGRGYSPARQRVATWLSLLDQCLGGAGGLDGTSEPSQSEIQPLYSAKPYEFDPIPKRDERFPDPYNMGVNAEVFLYDQKYPPEPKTLMMFYKRLREVDVPEMMASIISETFGKPWGYYRDMTRQLWDEARHAMMGEVGFANLGIDWPNKVMINYTWSLALNTQLKPIERHAVLYFIEQGLMAKTGKRFEWEVARVSKNPLSSLFQDYDWADEVLHARIGRDWYLKEFNNPQEAVRYGDECWSRVLMNWETWRQQGLTQHRNWWPELYRAACHHWRAEPDPDVLAYATTYQTVRADLRELTSSA